MQMAPNTRSGLPLPSAEREHSVLAARSCHIASQIDENRFSDCREDGEARGAGTTPALIIAEFERAGLAWVPTKRGSHHESCRPARAQRAADHRGRRA